MPTTGLPDQKILTHIDLFEAFVRSIKSFGRSASRVELVELSRSAPTLAALAGRPCKGVEREGQGDFRGRLAV